MTVAVASMVARSGVPPHADIVTTICRCRERGQPWQRAPDAAGDHRVGHVVRRFHTACGHLLRGGIVGAPRQLLPQPIHSTAAGFPHRDKPAWTHHYHVLGVQRHQPLYQVLTLHCQPDHLGGIWAGDRGRWWRGHIHLHRVVLECRGKTVSHYGLIWGKEIKKIENEKKGWETPRKQEYVTHNVKSKRTTNYISYVERLLNRDLHPKIYQGRQMEKDTFPCTKWEWEPFCETPTICSSISCDATMQAAHGQTRLRPIPKAPHLTLIPFSPRRSVLFVAPASSHLSVQNGSHLYHCIHMCSLSSVQMNCCVRPCVVHNWLMVHGAQKGGAKGNHSWKTKMDRVAAGKETIQNKLFIWRNKRFYGCGAFILGVGLRVLNWRQCNLRQTKKIFWGCFGLLQVPAPAWSQSYSV